MVIEILTIIAIITGPFVGIWAYSKIEDRKKSSQRKLDIFKTLMATRATVLSPEHVGALNRIDIEFIEVNEKPVREAWAVYLDHLSDGPQAPNSPPPDSSDDVRQAYQEDYRQYQARQETWANQSRDKLAILLSKMGNQFGYDFDEVKIKKAAYRPQRHDDIEQAQLYLLALAGQVFSGQQPLSMFVQNWPASTDEQIALTQALIDSLRDGAANVRIVEATEKN